MKSSTRLTSHTISVAATRVQNPLMWKPLTIASVMSSISIETKNQAMPEGEDGQRQA